MKTYTKWNQRSLGTNTTFVLINIIFIYYSIKQIMNIHKIFTAPAWNYSATNRSTIPLNTWTVSRDSTSNIVLGKVLFYLWQATHNPLFLLAITLMLSNLIEWMTHCKNMLNKVFHVLERNMTVIKWYILMRRTHTCIVRAPHTTFQCEHNLDTLITLTILSLQGRGGREIACGAKSNMAIWPSLSDLSVIKTHKYIYILNYLYLDFQPVVTLTAQLISFFY